MIISKDIDLFGSDMKMISPIVSAMSHVNCHYITDPSFEKKRILVGFPGSEKFAYTGKDQARFIYAASNLFGGLYVFVKEKVYRIKRSGEVVFIGSIDSDIGPISVADNGKEMMVVDGRYGYIINLIDKETAGDKQVITKITAEFFSKNPLSVIYQMGRFLVNELGTAKFYGSDIFDGTSWPALNFASAESYPDNLLFLVNGSNGIFYLFGNESIEIWYNTGGPDFPYEKMSGGVIEVGSISIRSVVKIDDVIVFLGRSRSSGIRVFVLSGTEVTDITSPQLMEHIQSIQLPSAVEASGYSVHGTSIYQLTFGVSGKTFFYDFKTQLWGQRKTRGNISHIFGLGTWWLGEHYFTCREDGTIFRLDNNFIKDGDYYQDMEFTGRHIDMSQNEFSVNSIQFVAEVGKGQYQDVNKPIEAMLSYSKDGGNTFTPEIFGSLGKIGDYLVRLIWRRIGRARDIVFRLRITDESKRKIVSAVMSIRD